MHFIRILNLQPLMDTISCLYESCQPGLRFTKHLRQSRQYFQSYGKILLNEENLLDKTNYIQPFQYP